jgi:hypothetical protein
MFPFHSRFWKLMVEVKVKIETILIDLFTAHF